MEETGKSQFNRFLRALYPLVLYILTDEIVLTLLILITEWVRQGGSEAATFCTEYAGNINAIESVFAMLTGFAVVVRFFRPRLRLAPDHEDREEKKDRGRKTAAEASLVIGTAALGFSINILFSLTDFTGMDTAASETAASQLAVSFLPGLLIYGLISPCIEEMVFRGILLEKLGGCMKVREAAFLSAVLFGVYHGNLSQGLYGAVMGIAFAYGVLASGSLALPIAMHALTNILVFTLSSVGIYETFCTVPWLAASGAIAGILFYFASRTGKNEKNE